MPFLFSNSLFLFGQEEWLLASEIDLLLLGDVVLREYFHNGFELLLRCFSDLKSLDTLRRHEVARNEVSVEFVLR